MSVHVHTMRSYGSAAVVLVLAVILLAWAYSPRSDEFGVAAVTGRVTGGGRPLGGLWVMFEEDDRRGFTACGLVHADGSFRMQLWGSLGREGVVPGTYRVHFIPNSPGALKSSIDVKYQDSRTSGLLVHVGPGWNDFVFSLPDPGRTPTLAQHR